MKTVKQYYSNISEQVLFEISLEEKNRCRHYYAFWISVKDLPMSELKFDDVMRIDKITQMHKQLLKKR
jgi:hypothetical protein